jgi:hypothetical protein
MFHETPWKYYLYLKYETYGKLGYMLKFFRQNEVNNSDRAKDFFFKTTHS